MSQCLAMLQKLNQRVKAGKNFCGSFDNRNNPPVFIALTSFQCVKKVIYGLLVTSCLSAAQVRAQSSEIVSGYMWHIPFSVSATLAEGVKDQEQFISDGIELFPLISIFGKPVSEPGAKSKSTNRPDEGNKARVGIEQKNKLTPDDSHNFWRLLFVQVAAFLVAFPVGAYFSMRANLRNDWRKHIQKGRRLKVPVLAMFSITGISDRIKPRSWQIWERKHWFQDMRICHGIEAAYRDAWLWKKRVTEKC
ncbi:hypothetical protein OM306_25880 [Escherichia albertii]|nr:hypothetical protein [Escherichia albertii]EHW5677874.1 hypothetical protein [Escherichia albertii]MCZ8945010.1 hypothetical protein [Escherichia albertii]MCZ8974230.1 hypothetical protein [Escherichia albertii]MCZ9003797.1 hypothetical protein [Escherichia albertii]